MKNNKLETVSNLFEGNEIRSIWNSEKEDYYFSVIDVISALTDNNYQKSRNYWKWLKGKLKDEGSELVSDTNQLKMRSSKDGKLYKTDTLNAKGILSVPSKKAGSKPSKELLKAIAEVEKMKNNPDKYYEYDNWEELKKALLFDN